MAEVAEQDTREGAIWINRKPTPDEFGAWFEKNVSIDEGLDRSKYIGGIVLIPAETTVKYVGDRQMIDERKELHFVPYAKVETRVAYFWDLMEVNAERWIGVIEPVESRTPLFGSDGMKALAEALPAGFTVASVPWVQGGKPVFSHYFVANFRVAVYERQGYTDMIAGKPAMPIRQGTGTKQVPVSRKFPDDNALMKVETGAIGRALGVAGIFIIPGSGVATAEDMLEAAGSSSAGATGPETGEAGPSLPAAKTPQEEREETRAQLVDRLAGIVVELNNDHKIAYAAWNEHLKARGIKGIDDADDVVLKGLVKKAEKLLAQAKERSDEPEEPTREMAPDAE